MRLDTKGLMRFYKIVAVLGIAAVAAPAFYMIFLYLPLTPLASVFCMLFAYPALIAVGYFAQKLMLGKGERDAIGSASFSFEQKNKLPPQKRLLGILLGGGAGLGIGRLLFALMQLLGAAVPVSSSMVMLCGFGLVSGAFGAILCGARFNQLIGVRSLVECCAVFAFYVGIGFYGMMGTGVVVLFAVAIYSLCFLLAQNQETILQTMGKSDTCHLTPEIVQNGVFGSLRLWASAIPMTWYLLSVVTFPSTLLLIVLRVPSLRMNISADNLSYFEAMFYGFPTQSPWINCFFFVSGLFCILGSLALLVVRRKSFSTAWLNKFREALGGFAAWFYQTFLQLRFRSEKSIPAVSPTQTDYTDRITKIKRQTRPRRVTYASFSRQLGSLSDLRAQYSYAYRTLVACMVQRNIGVEEHHTPAEACEIVLQKTNYREMGALTDLFLRLVYAGDQTIPEEELQAATKTACEIVKESIVTIS